jgi:hypothetical protein
MAMITGLSAPPVYGASQPVGVREVEVYTRDTAPPQDTVRPSGNVSPKQRDAASKLGCMSAQVWNLLNKTPTGNDTAMDAALNS